ncbi:MAG: biotin/lipoyl-binding protein [Bacteroidales bacterium]|nr:biotin/lipoyl-binding protein [Bacteroidales bacterium]
MKTYKFKINGKDYEVSVGEAEGKILNVNVNGADYQVELENAPAAVMPSSDRASQKTPDQVGSDVKPAAAAPAPKAPAGAGEKVNSPLPGVIVEVSVKEGQAVKSGQKVAVLEAMKMENEISAPKDGTITAIHVNKGDSILEGAPIVTIA